MLCGINCILLRGLGREAGHWLGFEAQLKALIEARIANVSCQVYTPDITGVGQRYQERTPVSIHAITEQLYPQIPEPQEGVYNVVVGLSMGGMIALNLAQRFPGKVAAVVLINSSTRQQPPWRRIKPQAMLISLLSLLAPWRQREAWMLNLVSNASSRELLQQWWQIQRLRPVRRRNLLAMLWAANRFDFFGEPLLPGLVITSKGDRMVSPRSSEALARQLRWPLLTHATAGHDLPLDDPAWLASSISHWLEGLVQSEASQTDAIIDST